MHRQGKAPEWQGLPRQGGRNNLSTGDPTRKESHMKKVLILLVLAACLSGACADTNNSRYQGRDSMINLANTCATCGATVEDNYFYGSNLRAIGPGSY
jgi:hypothetical protein